MIDLGYCLRRAWDVTRRHKRLWLFGFLVGLRLVVPWLVVNSSRWRQVVWASSPELQRVVADFLEGPYDTVVAVVVILLGVSASVALALLNAAGQAALVDQAGEVEDYESVDLRTGWQAGVHHLWQVFIIRLLFGLPVNGIMLAGGIPIAGLSLLAAGTERLDVVIPAILGMELAFFACLVPAFCLAGGVAIPLGVLQRLAILACVQEQLDVRQSVRRAWSVVREHLGVVALTWLALAGIGIGMLLVVGLPLVLMTLSILAVLVLLAVFSPLLYVLLTFLIGLAASLVGAAAWGLTEVFFSVVWVLLYREMTGLGLTGEEDAATGTFRLRMPPRPVLD